MMFSANNYWRRCSLRSKIALLSIATALLLTGCYKKNEPGGDEFIHFGVSAPLTGDNAEYAKLWREGFDIALDEINGKGGINGKSVMLDWEDTQSDPKQAVNVAQKFVEDSRILAEIGDFSSPASMAASPIYERGGMVQYGFTNSHHDFTTTGRFMFSTASTQEILARQILELAKRYGDNTSVLYVNNDLGKKSSDIYKFEAARQNVGVPVMEGFQDTSTDFRPLLLKVRNSKAPVLVIMAYYRSAALIVQQARQVGIKDVKIVWGNYNQEFIKLAGEAAEGVSVPQDFYAPDAGPLAEDFVRRFRARFNKYPDSFNVRAYDAVMQLSWAVQQQKTPTREGVRAALADGKNIPSVLFGPFSFGPDRRMSTTRFHELVVQGGQYVAIPVPPSPDAAL